MTQLKSMSSSYKIKNNKFHLINDLIPHSASFNMEFDQWLFKLALNKNTQNILRIYEWEKPSITYGKFQKIEKDANIKLCKDNDIEMVKRPTGGRAILHYNEITFSMIIKSETIEPYTFKNSFLLIANLIIESFKILNIEATINLKPEKYQNKSICFLTTSQYEILDEDGNKLTGIAQYFTKEAVLIQGSIPLKNNSDYSKYFCDDINFKLKNAVINKHIKNNKLREALIKSANKKLDLIKTFIS